MVRLPVKPLQFRNASRLIDITELGMVRLPEKPLQWSKAPAFISVMELPIVKLPIFQDSAQAHLLFYEDIP